MRLPALAAALFVLALSPLAEAGGRKSAPVRKAPAAATTVVLEKGKVGPGKGAARPAQKPAKKDPRAKGHH